MSERKLIAMMNYEQSRAALMRQVTFLLGENVSLSYPLPARVNGILTDTYFVYPQTNVLTRRRPYGLIRVNCETGALMLWQHCSAGDFMGEYAAPLTAQLNYALPKKLSIREFKLEQSLLYKMYAAIRTFAFADEPDEEQKELLRRYRVMLEYAVPADLLPYYLAMGKEFYDWSHPYV